MVLFVDIDEVEKARQSLPYLKQRRTDLYELAYKESKIFK